MRMILRMDLAAPSLTPESAVAGVLSALRVMAARFVESFGSPSALAKAASIYGKERERVLRWLHDMECVVRRLLLLRAASLPMPDLHGPVSRGDAQSAGRPPKEGDAASLFGPHDDADQWRVHFCMPAPPEPAWARSFANPFFVTQRPSDRRLVGGAPRKAGPALYDAGDPRPLAERFEALRRVIEDVDHYAARLAQRLHNWRGRLERRQIFLHSLCATAQIANEAGLDDAHWDLVGQARAIILGLLPVFLNPQRADHSFPVIAESG